MVKRNIIEVNVNRLLVFVVIFLSFFLFAKVSFAASYYIDQTNGNDSYDGLAPSLVSGTNGPWKTISKFNSSTFSAGDTIYLKRGEVWQETMTLPSSGTSSNVITIDDYGSSSDDRPQLSGLVTLTNWTVSTASANIYQTSTTAPSFTTLSLFEDLARLKKANHLGGMDAAGSFYLDGTRDIVYAWTTDSADPDTHTMQITNQQYGLNVNGKDYWTINSLDTSYNSSSGVSFRTTGSNNITLNDCLASWNGLRGFDWGGSGTTKSDIVVNRSIANDNLGEGFWIGFGSNNGTQYSVAYNNAKDNTTKNYNLAVAGGNYTVADSAVDNFVKNSHSYNCYGTTCLDDENENNLQPIRTVFDSNLVELNQQAIDSVKLAGEDMVFTNNIIVHDTDAIAVRVYNSGDNIQVYNNTIIQNASTTRTAIYVSGATNTKIKNNIIKNSNLTNGIQIWVPANGQTGFESDYNMFYGKQRWEWGTTFYTTLGTWQSASSGDTNSITGDPLFEDEDNGNYRLNYLSTAINKGTDLSSVFSNDYGGTLRPQATFFDIGAFEYIYGPSQGINQPAPTLACSDTPPGVKPPSLFGAISKSPTSILLYFTPASNPVDRYVLEYGTVSGIYTYGIPNMGINKPEQMTFLVEKLVPNTPYYFRLMGANGCATGGWSNEMSATTLSTSLVGSVVNSSNIITTTPTTTIDNQVLGEVNQSYNLKIKVTDWDKKPVEGAKVTVHSRVQEGITDKDGWVNFQNVEKGEHKILIAYNNYEGSQSLTVDGPSQVLTLNIAIEPKSNKLTPLSITIIGIMSIVIFIMLVTIIKVVKRAPLKGPENHSIELKAG